MDVKYKRYVVNESEIITGWKITDTYQKVSAIMPIGATKKNDILPAPANMIWHTSRILICKNRCM